METKQAIRKQIFALRKACTDEQVKQWSHKITENLRDLPVFKNAQRIMAYMDYKHEVMTGSIIEEAWKQGKEVAVPRVVGQDLVFYLLKSYDQLSSGCMGIMEPASGEIVDWQEALMIMPGVAFDRENHRVGYGGGFYDRFLEKHPGLDRVAVAFSFQILEEVPAEATDICPQMIVTEEELICKEELL